MFKIKHTLTIFFSEFSFESFIIHFVAVFFYRPYYHISELKPCCLSNIVVQKEFNRQSSIKKVLLTSFNFFRYLSALFKKNSSVKDLIYSFCLSTCFGRNNEFQGMTKRQFSHDSTGHFF